MSNSAAVTAALTIDPPVIQISIIAAIVTAHAACGIAWQMLHIN